ncbi:hypothetical protein D3C83_128250 [compost metagenome]
MTKLRDLISSKTIPPTNTYNIPSPQIAPSIPIPTPPPVPPTSIPTPPQATPASAQSSSEAKKAKEVPEDVLRKILE